jgi:predicted lipoprotein with Yx(FWY)xxD motif
MLLSGLLAAGCGSSSSTSSPGTTAAPAASSSSTSSSSAYAPAGGTPVVELTTKRHGKLGTILAAGPKRLTVYLFEADKAGKSACSGQCAKAWPPVIGKGKATGGASSSELATITRPDGKVQLTYKGHPLYYFSKDKDDGDAYGEGVKAFGASWYALAPGGKKVDLS